MNVGARQATGEILWFLHADTVVPSDWREQLEKAMADPHVVGGAFQVKIDAPGLRYRLLDLWGRWRPFTQRSFFGDQGIFVRREIFEGLGGFQELPVLEDVDFSHRLWQLGKVILLPGPLKTSARRWQTHGFWRTVLLHTRQALASPLKPKAKGVGSTWHLLKTIAVVVMAKAPVPGQVKTRLVPPLTPEQAALLAQGLLQETVKLVCSLKGIQAIVSVAPAERLTEVQHLLDCPIQLIPQSEGDFGARLAEVFRHAFSNGTHGVIALGADHPNLPKRYLLQAIATLKSGEDRVVLGPTEDGGYYLIGMTRPHPELFERIPWSTSEVARVTRERAKALGLAVVLLPPWFDIDRPEDLSRLTATHRLRVGGQP